MNLRSTLDANKLIDANFMNYLRNLRIVLNVERIAYVLNGPHLVSCVVNASDEDHKAYQKHLDGNVMATCIMLASMSPELQKQHEAMTTNSIVLNLRDMFHEQVRSERFKISKLLFRSKMQERTYNIQYAPKMSGYLVRLDQLGFGMDHELSIDLIFVGLLDSFA